MHRSAHTGKCKDAYWYGWCPWELTSELYRFAAISAMRYAIGVVPVGVNLRALPLRGVLGVVPMGVLVES